MRLLVPLIFVIASTVAAESVAVSFDIDSVVHPVTVEAVSHAIEQAGRDHAELVLLRLDTPGGMLEATRQIIDRVNRSPVPVVTFVRPGGRAASAGFFLLISGDLAAMASGTHTGAASPVLLGQTMDPVMQRKVESDTAAFMRSLAVRRGRNAEMAEKAVLEAKSFTDKEALGQHLADLIVSDEADLWKQLDGRTISRLDGSKATLHTTGIRVEAYRPTLRERAVMAIADPNLSFLLLIVGALLIYVEFSSPGLIAPGVAGAILVLLGLMSISVLPINMAGVALLALAAVMFALEVKIASHGVLGIGGAIAMAIGAVLLIDGPPEMRIRWSTAITVSVPFAAITIFLVTLIVKARTQPVQTGASGMLHEIGVAYTDIAPTGKVFIHGEYWDAMAEAPISRGTQVRVAAMEGLRLLVQPKG